MFKPIVMNEIDLFIKEADVEKVTALLHDLNLIQFFDLNKEEFSKYEHVDLNDLSKELLAVRSAINILKKYFTKAGSHANEKPIERTLELKAKLDKYESNLIQLKDKLKRQQILEALKITESELKNKNSTIGFIPKSKKVTLSLLRKKNMSVRTFKFDNRIYFFTKTKEIPFKFKEFYLPNSIDKNIEERISRSEKIIEDVKAILNKISNNNLDDLLAKENNLRKEIELIEVKPIFTKSKNLVVISGFVPKNKVKYLKNNLSELLADKFELNVSEAREDAPTSLSNPPVANNFQELLKMYSLPKYKEFDPTVLMFLMFPIFFGFILGDVFYGLISLIFFTILKKKKQEIKEFLTILQLSAVSSIFFGVIYGEFMGFETHGPFYGFFERSHHPETLLVFAIMFGILHINLGLLIGFINEFKNKKKAICDKLSWIILQIGILFIYLGTSNSSTLFMVLGILISIISLVLIYMGHGFIGIMEVPSFFTNILSYARLMAVGLSSIAIAMLINEYSMLFFSKGILFSLLGIILFTIGHLFNIVLGNFEGFLHTLRLHYVEFFTKFYTGGGSEFKPFGRKIIQD